MLFVTTYKFTKPQINQNKAVCRSAVIIWYMGAFRRQKLKESFGYKTARNFDRFGLLLSKSSEALTRFVLYFEND